MAGLLEFVERLLDGGEVVLAELPTPDEAELLPTFQRLDRAFAEHALTVAGGGLTFQPELALDAAMWLARACWFHVAPEIPIKPNHELKWPDVYKLTPSAHLTVDVVFRFAAGVHRRAKGRGADDLVAADVGAALRRWPLSGILADIEAGPTIDLEFGGHRGLQLLYAERLAKHRRAAWVPEGGRIREVVELVFSEQGLTA